MWYDQLTDVLLSKYIRIENVEKDAEAINSYEKTYRARDFEASSRYCEEMLRTAGLKQVCRRPLPMDGRTAYMDCIMPQAWDIEPGSFLKAEDSDVPPEFQMLADAAQDHFSCGIWSAPTPAGGLHTQLFSQDVLQTAQDITGKFVLVSRDCRQAYRECVRRGAAGIFMYDGSPEAYRDFPDSRRWGNGIGLTGWYHTAEDRRLVVYHATPRQITYLKKRLQVSPLNIHAVMNSRIFDGSIWTVTGILPGKSDKEVALLAHIYEPFLSDDAIGAAAATEIARLMQRLTEDGKIPRPQYTLRIVISMELYGFSEHFAQPEVRRRTLYAASLDSIGIFSTRNEQEKKSVNLRLTAGATPFFTDYLYRAYFETRPELRLQETRGCLSDDTFSSDPLIGVPVNWIRTCVLPYHHNTGLMFAPIDYNLTREIIQAYGNVLAAVLSGDPASLNAVIPILQKQGANEFRRQAERTQQLLREKKLTPADANRRMKYWRELILRTMMTLNQVFPDAISPDRAQEFIPSWQDLPTEENPENLSPAEKQASHIIVTRLRPGMIASQAGIPQPMRRPLPLNPVTMTFFDGERSVLEAIRLTEYDQDLPRFSEEALENILSALRFLEKYGYVKLELQ